MSVYISELFPNPAGKDTGNEWIEICNDGVQSQSLIGWKLKDASTKSFTISTSSIAPQSCVVFGNTETKISLNNDKETLSLFDTGGNLVDEVSYALVVKDDQALVRVEGRGELQITTTPTRGEIQNVIAQPITKNQKLKTEDDVAQQTTTQNGSWNVENGVQEHMLTSGMSIGEPILIGVCVVGILTGVFIKAALELRRKSKEQ